MIKTPDNVSNIDACCLSGDALRGYAYRTTMCCAANLRLINEVKTAMLEQSNRVICVIDPMSACMGGAMSTWPLDILLYCVGSQGGRQKLEGFVDAFLLQLSTRCHRPSRKKLEGILDGVKQKYIILMNVAQMYDFIGSADFLMKYVKRGHVVLITGDTPLLLTYAMKTSLAGESVVLYTTPWLYDDVKSNIALSDYMQSGEYVMAPRSFFISQLLHEVKMLKARNICSTPELQQLFRMSFRRDALNFWLNGVHVVNRKNKLSETRVMLLGVLQELKLVGELYTPQLKQTLYYPLQPRLCDVLTDIERGMHNTEALISDVIGGSVCEEAAVYLNVIEQAKRRGYTIMQYADKDGHAVDLVVNKGNGNLLCINVMHGSVNVWNAKIRLLVDRRVLMRYCDPEYALGTAPISVTYVQVAKRFVQTNGLGAGIECISYADFVARLPEFLK